MFFRWIFLISRRVKWTLISWKFTLILCDFIVCPRLTETAAPENSFQWFSFCAAFSIQENFSIEINVDIRKQLKPTPIASTVMRDDKYHIIENCDYFFEIFSNGWVRATKKWNKSKRNRQNIMWRHNRDRRCTVYIKDQGRHLKRWPEMWLKFLDQQLMKRLKSFW